MSEESFVDLLFKQHFFRIKEVSFIVRETTATLRYWENTIGLKVERKAGQRFYTRNDVLRLLRVKRLVRESGYTLAGVRKQMRKRDDF